MGRGLSELQRTMLVTAYRNRREGKPHPNGEPRWVDLYHAEAMVAVYGEVREIRKRRSAQNAITRARARLKARGLAEGAWGELGYGLRLTDCGMEVAEGLSVGFASSVPESNR
jgi:hypothetical protein